VRDTFAPAGIKMENFDALPNYWDTPAPNIRKRTARTRNCDACHVDRKNFLTKEMLIKNGSKANDDLIFVPKPINR
jgi:rubredoxin